MIEPLYTTAVISPRIFVEMEPRSCPVGWCVPKHDGKHPRLWAMYRQFGAENDHIFHDDWPMDLERPYFQTKSKRGIVCDCVHPHVIGKSSCWFVSAYFFFTNHSPANRCALIPGLNGGTHGSSPRTNASSPRCSQGAPKAGEVPLTAGFSFFVSGNSPRKYGYTAIHDIVIIDDNLTKLEMMFSTRNLTKISYFIGELIWFTVPRYTYFLFRL